jgi:hypothetical protein
MIILGLILLNGEPHLEKEIHPLKSRHRLSGGIPITQERLLGQILKNRRFTWRGPGDILSVRLKPSQKDLANLREILKSEGDTLTLDLQASFRKIDPIRESRLLENGWKRVV